MEAPASSEPSSPPQHGHPQPLTSFSTEPKPEKVRKPTKKYIAMSEVPSKHLKDPTTLRKLLILDLNGTLVFRSPHRSARSRRRIHGQGPGEELPEDPYQNPTAPRPLRPVHPRPFMPSFVRYLFHERTKAWLDTMVWSSAQPHSVADMVDNSFGSSRDELVAIWARDTLGLAGHQYYQKTQTTKDLATPWSKLPPYKLPSGDDGRHSATSTLLLDDSPRKAHLQPWNHLCIQEYVDHMWKADLDLAMREAAETPSHQPEPEAQADEPRSLSDSTSPVESAAEPSNKKRKRPKKKKKVLEEVPKTNHQYDPTLLAIIGILDTIRCESNVAAWLKNRGLFAGANVGENEEIGLVEDANKGIVAPASDEANIQDESLTEKVGISEERSSSKRRRVVDIAMGDSTQAPETSDASMDPSSSPPLSDQETAQLLWFQDAENFDYWVERGIDALKELDIELQHGIPVEGLENPHLSR